MKKGLFEEWQLRGTSFRNRIVMSPMQQYQTPDGIPGDWHMVHLGSRAVGGVGLIIVESTAVRPDGRATLWDTGLWNDEQAEAWRPILDFCHDWGAKVGVQLGHFGSRGSRNHPREGFRSMKVEDGGWPVISSSARAPFRGMLPSTPLTLAGIKEVQGDFVNAAKRAIAVGFDTIELHGAHGYLFHQFYSALINDRTDDYGGSLENRIRFMVETAAMVREAIPDDVPLLARISAVDHVDDEAAWDLEQSKVLVAALKNAGVDFVTASAGGFVYPKSEDTYPGYQVPFAKTLQESTGMPMGAVGLITDGYQAQEIIQQESATAVVIGRALLKNPNLAYTWAEELGENVDVSFPIRRGWQRIR